MRALIPVLLLAVLLVGCSAAPAPSSTAPADDSAAVLSDLRAEVTAVAEGNAAADTRANAVLEVVRTVDEQVARLESPARFDEALSGWEQDVHTEVAATSVEGLRQGYLDVAAAVDDARQTLAEARQQLDGAWEGRYLDAQDAVLVAVRSYAETADQLAQLLQQHWPTYTEVDTRVLDFAPRRGNYRDTQEAADALAVELDTVIDELVVAEAQIARYQRRRSEAGEAVNRATADALTVYEQRPPGG